MICIYIINRSIYLLITLEGTEGNFFLSPF